MKRRIIVCCDGTWNQPDQTEHGKLRPTNVVKLARSLRPVAPDGTQQIVYYHSGVGTGWDPLERAFGGAFGSGISENVQEAYRFLVNNFVEDDDIYVFGFSRGAYTVRSVAGFIRKCGLLRKQFDYLLPDAYQLYRSTTIKPDDKDATDFRAAYARETRIKFIGVWDTVGALGVPENIVQRLTRRKSKYDFHDVALSRSVDYAYQALAIDEKRTPFKPTLWEQNPDHDGQTMEQAWFAGVHTDVGGGSPATGLSDLAFLWMKAKAEATGLAFDDDYVAHNVAPDPGGALQDSFTLLYRAWAPYERPIGAGVPAERRVYIGSTTNETLASSALERYRQPAGSYRPANLKSYLDANPDPPVAPVPSP